VANLNKVGEGDMNYLFWTIYRAELFNNVPLLTGQQVTDAVDDPHQALRITYYKPISKQALIDATEDQWQLLGFDQQAILPWLASLEQIWPDVEPGDRLTLLVLPAQRSEFYLADRLIGTIQDQAFGDAFLAIWLSEQTSEPRLREKLLGVTR
jgi:hypothetical protein